MATLGGRFLEKLEKLNTSSMGWMRIFNELIVH